VPEALTQMRNREEGRKTYLDRHPELADDYNENDQFTPSNADRNKHTDLLDSLEDWEYDAIVRASAEQDFVYFLDFENVGGLPTPLPLLITDVNGDEEFLMLPAEIWRRDHKKITKVLIRETAIQSISLDPRHETADADFSNNHFPTQFEKSRIELYKSEDDSRNLMGDMLEVLRKRKGGDGETTRSVPLTPAN